jgi:hypothetical protein
MYAIVLEDADQFCRHVPFFMTKRKLHGGLCNGTFCYIPSKQKSNFRRYDRRARKELRHYATITPG